MTIKKFKYLKEGAKEPKEYEILILNKDTDSEYGIALSSLTEEEKTNVISIITKYEEDLKPYMKAFRNFKKNKMMPLEEQAKQEI